MTPIHVALAAAAASLLLAACGGGSGPSLTPQQVEDRRASASIDGLLGFARLQIAQATAEDSEPRPVDGIAPPTSETDEPRPL
jgi:hypothetical protein